MSINTWLFSKVGLPLKCKLQRDNWLILSRARVHTLYVGHKIVVVDKREMPIANRK